MIGCLAKLRTPPIVTTDFLYLRLIGDRSIQEKDFGIIQIDRMLDMQKWADAIKTIDDGWIRLSIVAPNSHYAGTTNVFRNMLGLSEPIWQEKEDGQEEQQQEQYQDHDPKQHTLSDILN